MKLIVGLGNPGSRYEGTRHNIGFAALDALASQWGLVWTQERFKAACVQGRCGTESVVLLKPQTFMNLSGESVQAASAFWKLKSEDVLVVHDELDLELGRLKLTHGAGPAGHRGVSSIITQLGTKDFYRLRLGIGRPVHGSVVDFVLMRFLQEESMQVSSLLEQARDASMMWVEAGAEAVQRRFHH